MDKNSHKIVIDSKLSSKKLKSKILVSKDLEKYFKNYNFYSEYDTTITDNKSILNIPVVSILLPIAWITGADIYVDKLDETFVDRMKVLHLEYKKIYPKIPFRTRLVVNELVKNENNNDGTALLFSGGVDSTYSLFSNIELKPRLIMIFGVPDIPIKNIKFQEILKNKYSSFAQLENININFIRTNALEMLNEIRLDHLWFKYKGRNEGNFWNGLGFSLGQLGQVAPLSIGRFSHLLIAAAKLFSLEEHPVASSPETDEKVAWANVLISHDGSLNRFAKLMLIKELINNNRIEFRVCWSEPQYLVRIGAMNCCKCEKCLRTIASLVLAGINPNLCGFDVDESIFNLMKDLFEKKILTQQHLKLFWEPIQDQIPKNLNKDILGSRKFFKWFKTMDINLLARSEHNFLSFLYYLFPYSISNIGRIVINRLNQQGKIESNTSQLEYEPTI